MKPVSVSTVVDRPREEVYDFLEDLANHEAFTDHMMVDWQGGGDRVTVRSKVMRSDRMTIDTIEKVRPERTVENAVGKNGARLTEGTYTLKEAGPGRTEVTFTFRYLKAPPSERGIFAPLVRAFLQRGNAKAMERLRVLMAAEGPLPGSPSRGG
jgi:hypothetical protein